MINTTPCQMARRRHFLCWAALKVFGKPPNLRVAERLELRGNAFLNILDRQPRRIALVFGLVLIVGIGVVDVLTGPELSFSIFYLLPVFLTTLVAGRFAGIAASTISALVWLVADSAAGARYTLWWAPYWNVTVRWGTFLLVAMLLSILLGQLRKEQEMAGADPLTGALNFRGFYRAVTAELDRAARYSRSVTLAFLDVDDFKTVNDAFGHSQGDACLRLVAATVRRHIRQVDALGRLGGDEFVLLLPETGPEAGRYVVEKLRQALLTSMGDAGYAVTFSIGMASTNDGGVMHVDDLVGQADRLMYEAKKSGKNAVRQEVVGSKTLV